MLFIYNLSLFFYALAIRFASWFNHKAKLFIDGRKGLPLRIKAQMGNENRPRIWMHCASLGEFEQGRPVLESIRTQYPDYAIVLTFFSPSGYQVRKNYKGVDYVFYLPMDSSSNAKQFVRDVNPSLAIFVKYDLWYYYLQELKSKNIPTVLIDAIFLPQQGFFKWYGGVQRRMLKNITQIFVQNEHSQKMLASISIPNVAIAGDTRFDRVLDVANAAKKLPKFEKLSQNHKLFIAGSTWAEDEQMLVHILPQLPANWKLIIVPHEVDESRISNIEKLYQGHTIRWSAWEDETIFQQQILIIDTIGLLTKIYRYGSIAWIGGGLGKGGVHNTLEAAAYGLPCGFGPVYQKYQEAIELVAQGAAFACKNAAEFSVILNTMLDDDNAYQFASQTAKNYVAKQGGATSKIMTYLAEKNWLNTL